MKKWFGLLFALVVVLLAVSTALTAEDKVNAYVGDSVKSCKMCHKAQVAAWEKWPMAGSWDKLSDEEKAKDECIGCHVTGYGEEGGWVSEKETPGLVGIQCEACHGPAGDHMKVPMTDREARKASMSEPDEASCLQCHIEEGNPNFKEFKYDVKVARLADHFNEAPEEEAEAEAETEE
jgi:hypothetical protein